MIGANKVLYMDDGTPYFAPTEEAHPFGWSGFTGCTACRRTTWLCICEPVSVNEAISQRCGPFTYRSGGDDEVITFDLDPQTWEMTQISHTLNGEPVDE